MTENAPITGSRNRNGAGMGMSPETANLVSFWGNWILIGALILGVLATFAVVVSGIVKDRAFEEYKVGASMRVADATKAGLQAGERAGHAQAAADDAHVKLKQAEAEIANANARAAEATEAAARLGVKVDALPAFVSEKEQALNSLAERMKRSSEELDKARIDAQSAQKGAEDQLELMRRANAPRDFTPEQQAILKQRLDTFGPLRVDILTFGDTKEIADFGRKISDIMVSAGWRPKLWSVFNGASYGVSGVPIYVKNDAPKNTDEAAAVLTGVLIEMGISSRKFDPFDGTKLPFSVNGPPCVAIFPTITAHPMASAGRFSPLGPRGINSPSTASLSFGASEGLLPEEEPLKRASDGDFTAL